MARSVIALLSVAILAAILVAAPCRADSIIVNGATTEWLDAWVESIPNLKAIWLNPDVCARSGIQCSSATNTLDIRLDVVTTSGFNFIGTLPEVAGTIDGSRLQIGTISVKGYTHFTGTLPASWSKISQLTALDVSETKLSGLIPDELGALSNLKTVDFSKAKFCYGMPNWNGTIMSSLTSALFTRNKMRGSFASSWSTFPSTLTLDLKGNSLCGCKPSSWNTPNLIAAASAVSKTAVKEKCKRVCKASTSTRCTIPRSTVDTPVATFMAAAVSKVKAAMSVKR